MAKATTTTADKSDSDGRIRLKPIDRVGVTMRINGVSPLIQHQWGEKALAMMRDKHAGKKTKNRDVRDPEQEGKDAMYKTDDGSYGIPAMAIKSAVITAAHQDIGVAKTLVRKALFIICKDSGKILKMECDEPVIKEDCVILNKKSADLRYRPYFYRWSVMLTWEMDGQLLQVDDLVNLVDRAGFGVGIGEWRPEKDGEYGRFEVDRTYKITEVKL